MAGCSGLPDVLEYVLLYIWGIQHGVLGQHSYKELQPPKNTVDDMNPALP